MPGRPRLDELMANAWPPVVVERHDGWRLRWADGCTRRANSALATRPVDESDHADRRDPGDHADHDDRRDLGGLVARAETFYRARGAAPLFQVSSASAPPALAPYLAARGYVAGARTLVAAAATAAVVDRTPPADGWSVDLSDRPTDAWFDTWWSVESGRGRSRRQARVCREVLLAPLLPSVFVAVRDRAAVIGVGQIVVEDGWAGVQCMATPPAHRRRGVASAVLHAAALAADDHRAAGMYLAVMAGNAGARALYRRAGFEVTHEYRYLAPR
ncbi:MAG TPA: GNAT family N-acetyltransferase [Acidimicrobiales bacterium]|nr:GNAT family N-acetyltransferase [Acidimicrobiales bacterium]